MKKTFLYLFSSTSKFILRIFPIVILISLFQNIKNLLFIKKKIKGKKLLFYIPSHLSKTRVEYLISMEPEMIEWLEGFDKNNTVFYDIGANLGVYSIYNSIVNQNSKTYSFEPSTDNLNVLSKNISLNNLNTKIFIVSSALTNKEFIFENLHVSSEYEGSAYNTFGNNLNNNQISNTSKYSTLGFSLNYLVEQGIIDFPNYIKIDVDGNEHLILEGASRILSDKRLKSIYVEIDELNLSEKDIIINLLLNNGFKFINKYENIQETTGTKFEKTFNYIFNKID